MANDTYHYPYKYHAELRSAAPAGAALKQRLAWRLRSLADRLDGHVSLSFTYRTTPELSQNRVFDCLRCGFSHANKLIESELRDVNAEQFMHDYHPALYDESPHRTETLD